MFPLTWSLVVFVFWPGCCSFRQTAYYLCTSVYFSICDCFDSCLFIHSFTHLLILQILIDWLLSETREDGKEDTLPTSALKGKRKRREAWAAADTRVAVSLVKSAHQLCGKVGREGPPSKWWQSFSAADRKCEFESQLLELHFVPQFLLLTCPWFSTGHSPEFWVCIYS